MLIGDLRVNWPYGSELAKELLEAIHLVGTTSINRIDLNGIKVYKAGSIVRVDIDKKELSYA